MSFGGIKGAATEVAPLGGKGGGTAAVAGDQQYGSESRGLLLGGAKEPLVGGGLYLIPVQKSNNLKNDGQKL